MLDIQTNIDNPRQLEKLYRENKAAFKTEFNLLYPKLQDNKLADYWNERLNYESPEISWGNQKELTFVIVAALSAGVIAKLPFLFNINAEYFYQRNIGFIVFPVLASYFIWKQNLSARLIAFSSLVFLASVILINLFPANSKSDTLILSCIHLPFFLWAIVGVSYMGDNFRSNRNRLAYLRYNGDLVIISALIMIAGGILTGITIGLFSVIGFNIKDFYFDNVVVVGLSALPVIATHITQTNPHLVNKISPFIAKLFSPLVLITLVIYLVAILFSGKDPYNDRNFLMIFNFLLIGVMALILFSIAEGSKKGGNQTSSSVLFALSLVTVIVNGIALSAILFRISEWGITPNRLAILGANVLMLSNLLIITFRLFKSATKKASTSDVENSISMFLPVYVWWTIIVTFIFPFIFHFK